MDPTNTHENHENNDDIYAVHSEMARHRDWWRSKTNRKDMYSQEGGAQTFKDFKKEIRQLKSTSLEQPLPSSTQATSITPGKIEPE